MKHLFYTIALFTALFFADWIGQNHLGRWVAIPLVPVILILFIREFVIMVRNWND